MFQKIIVSLVCFACVAACTQSMAQIDTVKIGVNGLTCSSCSKSVEEKLVRVAFVSSVIMNLNRNEATVLVDFSQPVDWNVLAKAVYNAGFSVGSFVVPSCNELNNNFNGKECTASYYYIGEPLTTGRDHDYTLIGKYFMDKQSFAKWKDKISSLKVEGMSAGNHYFYY